MPMKMADGLPARKGFKDYWRRMSMRESIATLMILAVILTAGCIGGTTPSMPTHAPNTITIASWNIENFGKAKATDPSRMQEIAQIMRNFDVIVVQEVSNVHEDDCPSDSCMLMQHAVRNYLFDYMVVESPEIGDERYMLVIRNYITPESMTRIAANITRDPLIFTIRANGTEFNLITEHTSPSKNRAELEILGAAMGRLTNTSNLILLGDLNADCDYLTDATPLELRSAAYQWVIPNDADTTVGQTRCAYDRIILTAASRARFTGNWGIYTNVTDDISDHYPVWAEFRVD